MKFEGTSEYISTDDLTLAVNTSVRKKWGFKNNIWLSYFGNSFNIRGW